jgi:hypothetical protein
MYNYNPDTYPIKAVGLPKQERSEVKPYGVYLVKRGETIVYVGSTTLPLSELENNHRRYKLYGYTESEFRKNLKRSFVFEWALERRETTRQMIEIEESALIRYFKPEYNKANHWGQYPWRASIHNGRYNKEMVME